MNDKKYGDLASTSSLQSLSASLQRLLGNISSQLRQMQLLKFQMGQTKGNVDIWGRLGPFLEQAPVIASDEAPLSAKPEYEQEQQQQQHSLGLCSLERGRELSELGKYYQRKAGTEFQPQMGEKLQQNTITHINSSLILARKGDKEGARLHIQLAESAMHTAGRFMSREEYAIFEEKVELRLTDIIEKGHRKEQFN